MTGNFSSLRNAIVEGREEDAVKLLRTVAKYDQCFVDDCEVTGLFFSLQYRRFVVAQEMIVCGSDVSFVFQPKLTDEHVLGQAILADVRGDDRQVSTIRAMIEAGADANATFNFKPVLDLALRRYRAAWDNYPVIEALLSKGADLDWYSDEFQSTLRQHYVSRANAGGYSSHLLKLLTTGGTD